MADKETLIVEKRDRGPNWLLALLLLVGLIAVIFLFMEMSNNEAVKDAEVTQAAQSVGQSARDVGDAAQDAAAGIRQSTQQAAPAQDVRDAAAEVKQSAEEVRQAAKEPSASPAQ